jgi:hypothetical protein
VVDFNPSCLPTTTTTRTTKLLTTKFPTTPITSQLLTTDGRTCSFPFRFNSTTSFDTCVPDNTNKYWCSLTLNFDQDQQRADCSKGLTQYTRFSLCRSQSRTMSCPKGYVLHLISVTGFRTNSGACDEKYHQKDILKSVCSFLTVIQPPSF